MKKRIVITFIAIIIVTSIIVVISTGNKKVYTEIDGIKYAILVNGVTASTFPSGNYKVNITCTNADAYWDSVQEKIIVKNIKGDISCDVAFNSITNSDYINTYLISLSETTQGEGQMVSENGYRYEGVNPNNYVMFNNELWRIIGVFSAEYDTNNDGTTDTTDNLVKIIREESIGAYVWNVSNLNDWPNSSLYQLLNKQYYDWNTNKTTVSDYCYNYSSTINPNIPAKCDYSVNGIQDGYRGMIVKAKWYLGGGGKTGYTTYTPDSIYSYERDANAVYTGRSANTLGYIGLMYESDYLYGALSSNCARTTAHDSYNNGNCAGKDWLYGKGNEWTISNSSADRNYVWYLNFNGQVKTIFGHGNRVRPVLYLSSSVYKVSGSGTITDPYIIGMAS